LKITVKSCAAIPILVCIGQMETLIELLHFSFSKNGSRLKKILTLVGVRMLLDLVASTKI
jgi:hypothetical protein